MTGDFVAFDIEVDKNDMNLIDEMNIICAGVLGGGYQVWEDEEDMLSGPTLSSLAAGLVYAFSNDRRIVTWNGMGFDFRILYRLTKSNLIKDIAYNHYDIMFQFMTLTGFPVGLDAVARGFGMAGKPEGVDGKMAPLLWREGRRQEVLDYLKNDVEMTICIANKIEQEGEIAWYTKAGKLRTKYMPKLLTVSQCMALEMPDNSWMDTPLKRKDIVAWMGS